MVNRKVINYHKEASIFSNKALSAYLKSMNGESESLYKKAAELEEKALENSDSIIGEGPYSKIFLARSAAYLHINCKNKNRARELALEYFEDSKKDCYEFENYKDILSKTIN